MLDKVLIHIGYHNTATTWLQEEIFTGSSNVFKPLSIRNSERCRELGRMFYATADDYPLSPFDLNHEKIAEYLHELVKLKPQLLKKYPVFSDERLSGHYASAGFDAKEIANRLYHVFPLGKVMIVIRRQPELLSSSYFQYLYVGGTLSFEKFTQCNYDDKRPFFSPYHFDFLPLVKYYFQLFGKENVLVLPQEFLSANGPAFIATMGKFIGQEINTESTAFKRKHNTKENEFTLLKLRSLSYLIHSKSYTNYMTANNSSTIYMCKKLRQISGRYVPNGRNIKTREEIRAKAEAFFGNRFFASNSELASIINFDLKTYNYY